MLFSYFKSPDSLTLPKVGGAEEACLKGLANLFSIECAKCADKAKEGKYQRGDLFDFSLELYKLNFEISHNLNHELSKKFNEFLFSYKQLISCHSKNISSALLFDQGDLSKALAPYMNKKDVTKRPDDADVIAEAVLGMHLRFKRTGAGNLFCSTPVRHLKTIFTAMDLTENDVVLDLGGGIGLTAIYGTHFSKSRFICAEIDNDLYLKAAQLTNLVGFKKKSSAVQVDVLTGNLPYANKYFCYEPVRGERSVRLLALRLESISKARPITIGCYSHPDSHDDLVNALIATDEFTTIRPLPLRDDVTIFKTKA